MNTVIQTVLYCGLEVCRNVFRVDTSPPTAPGLPNTKKVGLPSMNLMNRKLKFSTVGISSQMLCLASVSQNHSFKSKTILIIHLA